ncbi:MAG: DUF1150 family protein [Alphaproteobacteria bacterium]|nr:DUF1150 family protein [Alphaproteobacteria bacterium]MBR6675390.1 DUF1150 family protein [Alphaproteobacteria bacterium]
MIKEQRIISDTFCDTPIQMSDEAYIRQEPQTDKTVWAIYDTNGEKIGHANSREVAIAVALQNDLTPFNVH